MDVSGPDEDSVHTVAPNALISLAYLLEELTIGCDICDVDFTKLDIEQPRVDT